MLLPRPPPMLLPIMFAAWNPVVAPVLPVALAALRPPNPPPRPPPVDIDVKAVPKPVVPDMLVSQARGRRRELKIYSNANPPVTPPKRGPTQNTQCWLNVSF